MRDSNRRLVVWSVPILAIITTLILASIAVAQTLQIGALQFLPGDNTPAQAVEMQNKGDIASSGSGYLAVWEDRRTVLGFLPFNGDAFFEPLLGNARDIYAARLDENGNLIDTTPIIIDNAGHSQEVPQVAWNGQNWLVVYTTERDAYFYVDIVARRVSPQGTVLDAQPIVIRQQVDSNDDPGSPAVASDGTNWAVAWEEFDNGIRGIKGTLVLPDGTVQNPNGRPLFFDSSNSFADHVAIGAASDQYLISWTQNSGEIGTGRSRFLMGRRLTATLDPIEPTPFVINDYEWADAERPQVATSGPDFFVTWHDDVNTNQSRVFGARISHDGQVLDPSGILISDLASQFFFSPDVTWDGTRWIVIYNRPGADFGDHDLYYRRVTADGNSQGSSGLPLVTGPERQSEPAVAEVAGGGAQVVWTQNPGSGLDDVYASRVEADGTIPPLQAVSLGRPRQTEAFMASTASEHLIVFLSEVAGETRVLAQRVDASGNALDAAPILVASDGEGELANASAAWNGSLYLVVWEDTENIYGRRLAIDGTPLDAGPRLLMSNRDDPAVGALGDTFLVVGTELVSFHQPQRWLEFVRVGNDGTVIEAEPVLIRGGFELDPRVASFADRWLVVWEAQSSHDNPSSSTLAAFVSAAGEPGTPFVVDQAGNGDDPDVTVNGDVAFVVWSDNADFNNAKIDGRLLRSDGSFAGDEVQIVQAANDQMFPAVTWNGQHYIVGWVDYRSLGNLEQLRGDIFVARVDPGGTVVDSGGVQVSQGPLPEEQPELASLDGTALLAYSAFDPQSPTNYRIGLRTLSEGPSDSTPTATAVSPTATSSPTPTSTPGSPTATPTATVSPTPADTPTAAPTQTPVNTAMHVGDLDGTSVKERGNWQATITIHVHDASENAVSGVTTSGTWSGGFGGFGQCTTDSSGACSVTSDFIPNRENSVTFAIDNLSTAGYTYDASANHDPDGDSNGTTITVTRP